MLSISTYMSPKILYEIGKCRMHFTRGHQSCFQLWLEEQVPFSHRHHSGSERRNQDSSGMLVPQLPCCQCPLLLLQKPGYPCTSWMSRLNRIARLCPRGSTSATGRGSCPNGSWECRRRSKVHILNTPKYLKTFGLHLPCSSGICC